MAITEKTTFGLAVVVALLGGAVLLGAAGSKIADHESRIARLEAQVAAYEKDKSEADLRWQRVADELEHTNKALEDVRIELRALHAAAVVQPVKGRRSP